MANDFQKKEPTKTEKMIYELVMNQNSMERGLWSTSTLVIILAMLTKQEPEKIAELMVNGDSQIKEFSNKVNEAVKKLEAEKFSFAKASEDKHKGHDHGDHSHEDAGKEVSAE